MRAAQATGYQDVLKISVADVPRPVAEYGQIIVEVYAAAANPFDYKVAEGAYKNAFPVNFPAILGSDVAGVVAEVGEGVEAFSPGQAVYGMANAAGGHGSFAEFTAVAAGQLAPKPESVDFVAAAALPLAGVSAYQAIIDHINLQSGQKILIHGGAGGIGSLAIQIAKNRGAYIATTVAASDADFVKQLGADETIDYQSQDFAAMLSDYDAVFDTVGGDTNTKSYAVLQPGGVLVSMLVPPDNNLAKQYQVNYVQQSSQATPERLIAVAELVDSGKLKPTVDKTFSLDQTGEALNYLKTGHPKGKVVIQVK